MKKRRWIGEKIAVLVANFLRCLINYDIFHFHFGLSLLPYNIDLPILRLAGKKVIMHYWGDDIRQNDVAAKYTYLKREELRDIYPSRDDKKVRERVNDTNRLVNTSIVGDFSLLTYSPKSVVIKQAIDLSDWNYVGPEITNRIRIVHAPSNRNIKGTKYILPVIETLKREGYNIDFVLLENMSNQQVREHCRDADIVIDQLLLESYGIFAIECMAMGKPVLCRIDEHFVQNYPDMPIVITDPDNLYHNLKELIEHPELRESLGRRGRIYVEQVHDAKKIAGQMALLYQSL